MSILMKACEVKVKKVYDHYRLTWENICCVKFSAYINDPAEVDDTLKAHGFEIKK